MKRTQMDISRKFFEGYGPIPDLPVVRMAVHRWGEKGKPSVSNSWASESPVHEIYGGDLMWYLSNHNGNIMGIYFDILWSGGLCGQPLQFDLDGLLFDVPVLGQVTPLHRQCWPTSRAFHHAHSSSDKRMLLALLPAVHMNRGCNFFLEFFPVFFWNFFLFFCGDWLTLLFATL